MPLASMLNPYTQSSINYLDVEINPMTYRAVNKVFTAAASHDGDGVALRRAFPGADLTDLDPFLDYWPFSPRSSGRFCRNECAPAWPTPGRTASAWAVPQPLRCTPPRSGNNIALASPKLRSPAGSESAALPYAESWVIPPRNRSADLPLRRATERTQFTEHAGRLRETGIGQSGEAKQRDDPRPADPRAALGDHRCGQRNRHNPQRPHEFHGSAHRKRGCAIPRCGSHD